MKDFLLTQLNVCDGHHFVPRGNSRNIHNFWSTYCTVFLKVRRAIHTQLNAKRPMQTLEKNNHPTTTFPPNEAFNGWKNETMIAT